MSEETTTPRSEAAKAYFNQSPSPIPLFGQDEDLAWVPLAQSQQLETELSTAHATITRLTEERDKLMQHERMANQLYTTLRSGQIPPENGTGLIDEVRHIMNGRELLRSLLNQALARVEETKDDAAIVDWLEEHVWELLNETPRVWGTRGWTSNELDLRKAVASAMKEERI